MGRRTPTSAGGRGNGHGSGHGDDYELVSRLAVGGMSEIYLARPRGGAASARPVVVKLLMPHFMCDQEFVQLFLDEARLAIQLEHDNIGRVHDSGVLDGRYFFAMEYLHGKDAREVLDEVMARGERLPLEHALTIVSRVASALHYAHSKRGPDGRSLQIVHRDVSPANIVVTYDGQVKLVDFGIARTTNRTVKTRTGTVRGKSEYMSPEQCLGETVDARSDLFSLGIVLYELVTAARLFRPEGGESDYQVMNRIVCGEIPLPSSVVDDLPGEVEQLIMGALARDPDDRFASAGELQLAIEGLARDLGMTLSTEALSDHLVELFGRVPEPWRDLPGAEEGDAVPEFIPTGPGRSPAPGTDQAIPDPVSRVPTSRRLVLPLPADEPSAGESEGDDREAVPAPITVEQTLPTPPAPIEFDLVSIEFIPPPQPRPWRWLLLAAVLVGGLGLWWL